MNRFFPTWWTFSVVLLAQIISAVPQPLQAADCKSLAQEIKRERSIISQKAKLADAVKVCPNSMELNFLYGYTLERLRDYDLALKFYKVTVGLDSKSASAWFGLGDVYTILGEAKPAVDAYEKGLKITPGDRRAKKSLESALSQLQATGGKQKEVAASESEPPQKKATTVPPAADTKVAASSSKVPPPVPPSAGGKQAATVPSPQQKVVIEVKEAVQESVVTLTEPASAPVSEQPGKEDSESARGAQMPAKKTEKLLVLEPRVLKIPVSKVHPVTETNKAKAEDTGQVVAPPAPPSASPAIKVVLLSIQPGKRIDPQLLQRSNKDQIGEFRLALENEAARRQPLILPDFRIGLDLAGFKKIQDGRREEIANSAKIDALPIDIERPIVPYFKVKRLISPIESSR